MRTRRLRRFITAVAATAALPLALLASAPTEASSVVPVVVDGNASCSSLGYGNGFKYDAQPSGTITTTLAGAGGKTIQVQISSNDGVYFDWLSLTGYVNAVIVKGGSDSNSYVYVIPAYQDTGLHAPANASGGYAAISHIEFCTTGGDQQRFSLDASKTAAAQYKRSYTWTIDKSVDDDLHHLPIGGSASSEYTVTVDQTVVDSDFTVAGVITISNNSPFEVPFTVADTIGSVNATVDCGANSVSAGGSVTCTYSASLSARVDGTNTVEVTSLREGVLSAPPATANFAFGDPTTIVGYPTINVDDNVQGALGNAVGDATFTYTRNFDCPTDQSLYVNGVYDNTYLNTATIKETSQSDSETVQLYCYAPVVSKTAAGTYDEQHKWEVTKSVDPATQNGHPGDTLSYEWTVKVVETVTDENISVAGNVTIANPAPFAMEVVVSDTLDDGTPATVTCPTSTVPAGGSITCTYKAEPAETTATQNTATVVYNSLSFSATAAVSFTADIITGSVTLDDDQNPAFPLTISDGGTWTYSEQYTCSTSKDVYGSDGTYEFAEENIATIKAGGEELDRSSASERITCEAGFVDLVKYTDGVVNTTKDWKFKVFFGPDGFGGNVVGTESSTLNDADGVLEFGKPALDPTLTYTVCELGVPAGWTSLWQVDKDGDGNLDGIVVPYNPNADDTVPQDVGNRCVDFGADTTLPVMVGTTIRFQVDNTYPGGAPRTPGYWKNWNSCTAGGQAANALRNGGWEEGYWLLDNVLDVSVGGGITWDDILADSFGPVQIVTCENAVEILDQRVVTANGIVGDGKKLASDGARTLAMHLLAAQLNQGAGACNPGSELLGDSGMTLDAMIVAGETLLDKYNFDGTKSTAYLTSKSGADYTLALRYASYLDQYNNGMYCGNGN